MAKVGLYFHTIRHLKPVQVFGRLSMKFKKPKRCTLQVKSADCSYSSGVLVPFIFKKSTLLGENEFEFLNIKKIISRAEDWNDPGMEKLWLYNLHYFDELNIYNSREKLDIHKRLIYKWIDENPWGHGNGWEPYTLSLRIVNWIKWLITHGIKDEKIINSLFHQVHCLNQIKEFHLQGNHLFENLKALCFAGLFFGKKGQSFLESNERLLHREIKTQFLRDGSHFEQSPMYHGIMLEGILDLINIYRAYERPLPLEELATKALQYMEAMSHPDGEVAFFNDSAMGIAPLVSELKSYCGLLGIEIGTLDSSVLFKESGRFRFQNEDFYFVCDFGPIGPDYLPGHAHADELSFELSYKGERMLVNSGTSSYQDLNLRHKQRQTKSHNTVTVDGLDSSELWGAFRVARRAQVQLLKLEHENSSFNCRAFHNGFSRAIGGATHEREFSFSDKVLQISDKLFCGEGHEIRSYLHFSPLFKPVRQSDGVIQIEKDGSPVAILESDWKDFEIQSSRYYSHFGKSTDNYVIKFFDSKRLKSSGNYRIRFL